MAELHDTEDRAEDDGGVYWARREPKRFWSGSGRSDGGNHINDHERGGFNASKKNSDPTGAQVVQQTRKAAGQLRTIAPLHLVVAQRPRWGHWRCTVAKCVLTANCTLTLMGLGGTSVDVQLAVVGRPGLDPGTLGLKVPCSSG